MADLSSSLERFFSAASVKAEPITLTILNAKVEKVSKEGEPVQQRPALYFKEDSRALVLNKSRYRTLTALFGTPDTDKWAGKKIKLVFNPDILFKGQPVGGISVTRA